MSPTNSFAFPSPAGEMAALVREKDWAQTPLGARALWPKALEHLVEVVLNQPIPMILLWGPRLVQIYNDGYRVIAGSKHPRALGQPTYECWSEISELIKPYYDRVLGGESFSLSDLPLQLNRGGKSSEAFISVSYSPVRDDTGQIAGILAVVVDTTDKVIGERERELIESQRELALEAGRMGWWHLNPLTGKIYWDQRLREIFGFAGVEIDYAQVLSLILPEDSPKIAATVAAAIDPVNPQPYLAEYRFRHPDGGIRWMRSVGQAVFEGEGKQRRAVSLAGTAMDVTPMKRAEATLQENADRLNLALAAGELGDWSWDAESDIMTLSSRAAEIYGVPADLRTTRTELRKLLVPTDAVAAKQALERSLRDRTDYDIEYQVKRPDGKIVWVAARGRGVFSAEGKMISMLGVVHDITRSRELFERTETERSRLSAALMQSPAFMCVLRGRDLVFEFANDKYYQLIGDGRQIIGRPIREALPEIAGQGYFELLDRVMTSAEPFVGRDLPVKIARQVGGPLEERTVDFVYQPLTDAGGLVGGILVHGIDTTDKKEIQLERERLLESERAARAESERAGRMKDEFLATVSHELRTPLGAILGWTQVLKEIGPTADLNEALDTIERNARAQAQIVEDLLDMSRIISGKLRLDVQRVDLSELIRAGLDNARPGAEAKGVKLTSVLDPLAGPIKGDPGRLTQVVWNLVSNAIKFTPKNGRVQVSLERINSHVEISVTDNGSGIAPEFLPFVFDRFRQSDSSSTRRHGGLGLGLAIVKQLVELHGGSVRAQSPGTGQGATFAISLPLMAAHDDGVEVAKERRHPKAGRPAATPNEALISLTGVRVLAVDDEPDTRSFIQRLLENHGAVVATAESAAEAIVKLKDERFNVLVSDIGMPREDGYELIRRVRELPAEGNGNIPALALTAYARSEDRMRAIRSGFQMHLTKPVENVELLTMVASLAGVKL